jgi:RHH-type rel operon transcriptional repressor/antitoxin RelB
MATSIRLNPETERRLDLLATQTGRTKAFYLRELIERGLDDIEDYYLSADALERVRQGRENVLSAAEVRNDHKDRRQAFVARAARLRERTVNRACTPAETLVREDRQRRSRVG